MLSVTEGHESVKKQKGFQSQKHNLCIELKGCHSQKMAITIKGVRDVTS